MASMKVLFESEALGKKIAPVGFSWTSYFFGAFPAAVRGDWKGFFVQMFFTCITCGLAYFYFPFTYNKTYIMKLLAEGYTAKDFIDGNKAMAQAKLGIDLK